MVERRSALAGHYETGRFGAHRGDAPGVTLSERRGLELVLLSAFAEDRPAAEAAAQSVLGLALPAAGRASAGERGTILWQGPDRWQLAAPEGTGLPEKLEAALAGQPALAVTDIGHGRTVIRLEGPRVRELLAKESPIDLSLEAFPAGSVAMTRFGQLAVTLHAVEADVIDVLAFRSFGLALFEELCDRAEELGYAIAGMHYDE